MEARIHAGFHSVLAARLQAETRQQDSLKVAENSVGMTDTENADASPAALEQKIQNMSDDMANVAAQFRQRRNLENKTSSSDDGFERVLDEDAASKGQLLIKIAAAPHLSLDALLAQARALFADDSDLFLVLKELLRRKDLSEVQREHLGALLDKVVAQANPRDLKAGVNCALKARLFGASLGMKASLLRQSYRRFLESRQTLLSDYEDWICAYGYRNRFAVIDFLQESLCTDIRSENPSCDQMEFGDLLGRLRGLLVLRSADKSFVSTLMLKKLVRQEGGQEEADWLLLMCGLLGGHMPAETVIGEALDAAGMRCAAEASHWIVAVRAAFKKLPAELLEAGAIAAGLDVNETLRSFDRVAARVAHNELAALATSPRGSL